MVVEVDQPRQHKRVANVHERSRRETGRDISIPHRHALDRPVIVEIHAPVKDRVGVGLLERYDAAFDHECHHHLNSGVGRLEVEQDLPIAPDHTITHCDIVACGTKKQPIDVNNV
jgi:hypothetical protein